MTDASDDEKPAGCVQGCFAIIVLLMTGGSLLVLGWLLFGGIVTGLINFVIYPGYESCQTQVRAGLREPSSGEFSWPPITREHRTDPNRWVYMFEVSARNGFGGRNTRTVTCEIDDTGENMRVNVQW